MTILRLLVFIGLAMLVSCQSAATKESTAFVLPDVHDPAQLVRVGDALLLYASPVEWWAYNLEDREWRFLGDDLYNGNNPDPIVIARGAPSMALWQLTWSDGWPQIDTGYPVKLD